MITCGIDFSKNSPGVCIRTDNDIKFLSFIRGEGSKKERINRQRIIDSGVDFIINKRTTPKDLEYTDLEIYKLYDAIELSKSIINTLPEEIDGVGIEGFSYGSKGGAVLDIAGYAYCMRILLFEKYGKDKVFVFSPGSVKKSGGKGNAGKEEMFQYFMNENDDFLKETNFWKGLKSEEIKAEKPVDDICDSFYVEKCTRNHLNSLKALQKVSLTPNL